MSRVGGPNIYRFLCLRGSVCYMDANVSSPEFFSCFLVNGEIVEQNVDNYIAGQLYGGAMSWSEWHQYYPEYHKGAWCGYILRMVLIVLGARVRCALARDVNVSRFMILRMWNELNPVMYGTTTPEGLDYVLGEDLIDVVSTRRVFTNLVGDPVYSRGLYMLVARDGPYFEMSARCYEWYGWGTALAPFGK